MPFWLSFVIPVCTVLGIAWGGVWIALMPAMIFIIIPLADAVLGLDEANAADVGASKLADLPVLAWLPVQVGVVGWFVARAGGGAYAPAELVTLCITVGLTAGAGGINAAHELMHRSAPTARGVAELLMASVLYPHFCVEHVHGHHRNVATPADPATSRRGESLFAFWPRTIWGSLRSAWSIESRRIRRGQASTVLGDRRIRHPLLATSFGVGAFALGGGLGLAAYLGVALVAILLLETINYIEHYGLNRVEIAPGRYERVRPHHSWNASHRVSNWYLFNLQRHSDHHFKASRPFWALRHHDNVPQLPFSYPTAFLVALVPPMWRAIMDPRLDAQSANLERLP
jgi:alkane 1-monooxygenase